MGDIDAFGKFRGRAAPAKHSFVGHDGLLKDFFADFFPRFGPHHRAAVIPIKVMAVAQGQRKVVGVAVQYFRR
jgi:hypothetical protein